MFHGDFLNILSMKGFHTPSSPRQMIRVMIASLGGVNDKGGVICRGGCLPLTSTQQPNHLHGSHPLGRQSGMANAKAAWPPFRLGSGRARPFPSRVPPRRFPPCHRQGTSFMFGKDRCPGVALVGGMSLDVPYSSAGNGVLKGCPLGGCG